jgi:hypothetical protein
MSGGRLILDRRNMRYTREGFIIFDRIFMFFMYLLSKKSFPIIL